MNIRIFLFYINILNRFFFNFRIDSMMLVDEGFKVVSVDASDKMLKYALKARWENRKNPNYDQWGMYCLKIRTR